jgi:hypothetical protein
MILSDKEIENKVNDGRLLPSVQNDSSLTDKVTILIWRWPFHNGDLVPVVNGSATEYISLMISNFSPNTTYLVKCLVYGEGQHLFIFDISEHTQFAKL